MRPGYPKTLRWLLVALGTVLCGGPCGPGSAADISSEYQFKAVCLVRFAQFVEWPPSAFANSGSPIVIGVMGANPFGDSLQEAVRQVGLVRNRAFSVEQFKRVEEIRVCHILFISTSEDARLEKVLVALHGRSILTVGESENFALRGGMIRFRTVENKLRFFVNVEQARSEGLQLSSKLLQWAKVVKATPE